MWTQFWVQNIHYVIEVFVAFVMLISAWVHLDGWFINRKLKTFFRSIGFFVLMFWSLSNAAPIKIIEFVKIVNPERFTNFLGLIGFGFIFLSLIVDPVPVKPGKKLPKFFSKLWPESLAIIPFIGGILISIKGWTLILSIIITILFWLHYSYGIQSEWRFLYLGFLVISFALVFSIASIWQESSNVLLARLAAPYSFIWMLEHGIKLAAVLLLGVWAWGFVRFRLFLQLFASFIALAFIIFIITTITYSGFLLNNMQQRTIDDLEINVKTLDYALNKMKESAILAARIASTNSQVKEAINRNDKDALFSNLSVLMFENETDFMMALNTGGEVLIRAEDKEQFGDSMADDPVVWRALDGKAVVTIFSEEGVTIPKVSIKASSPIIDASKTGEPEIIGAVVTGYLLDLAFVDGIKNITGLDVMVFADNTISATTFASPESQIRMIGVKESDDNVLDTVLKKGNNFTGTVSIFNRSFLAAYIPLQDVEETTIGMLFTGKSKGSILDVASETMQVTFLISILLMIFSILPLWWLARFISYNQNI
ncbi:cache domain-containing protein [Patescibacteria group bacterium]